MSKVREITFGHRGSRSRREEDKRETLLSQMPTPLQERELLQEMWLSIDARRPFSRKWRSTFGEKIGEKMVQRVVHDVARREGVRVLHK